MENVEMQPDYNDTDEYSNHIKIKKIKRKIKTLFEDINGDVKVKLEAMQRDNLQLKTRLDTLEMISIPSFKYTDTNQMCQAQEVCSPIFK